MSARPSQRFDSPNAEALQPRPKRRRWTGWWLIAVAVIIAVLVGVTIDRVLPAVTGFGLTDLGRELPSSIQGTREIRVASEMAYPGVESIDPASKKVQGIDVDLCQAIAQRFGNVHCNFIQTPTARLLPSLLAGQADIVMSGFGDSLNREQSVDLIDYYASGVAFLTHKPDATKFAKVTDFCGQTISVQFALQESYALDLAASCKALNKPQLKLVAADLGALEQGKVTAALADYPTAVQVVRRHPELAIAGGRLVHYPTAANRIVAPWGIAVRKDDANLRQALMSALSAIMADGTYQGILSRWGTSAGAITVPQLNCSSTGTCPVGAGG